tara:strand:+ start:2064 stop:2474 length:411 start_codon:yes stop_codon:yes gene_type:complete
MIKCFLPIFFVISLCVAAQDFKVKYPINTGVNMTVAILEVDSSIAIGDTIVALYEVDDDMKVGGLTVWNGTRLAIALWGNDSTSEIKDGFGDRETIRWIRKKNNYNIELKPTYRAGGNNWQANGIAIIEKLSVLNK